MVRTLFRYLLNGLNLIQTFLNGLNIIQIFLKGLNTIQIFLNGLDIIHFLNGSNIIQQNEHAWILFKYSWMVWTFFKQFSNGLNTVSLNIWMGTGHLMLVLSSGNLVMGTSMFFVHLSCDPRVVESELIQKFKFIEYFLKFSKTHIFKHFE